MRFRVSTLVNIMLGIVLVVSIASNLTGAVDYDPWLDVTDDGYGGVDDIVFTAEHFGASGDPIKQCNITNWPKGTAVTVFYSLLLTNGQFQYSSEYDADGFRYMHILIDTMGLSGGETVDIDLYSRIYDPSGYRGIVCYTITLTSTFNEADVVLYVPSENFHFQADAATGTTVSVYLSFYLT